MVRTYNRRQLISKYSVTDLTRKEVTVRSIETLSSARSLPSPPPLAAYFKQRILWLAQHPRAPSEEEFEPPSWVSVKFSAQVAIYQRLCKLTMAFSRC